MQAIIFYVSYGLIYLIASLPFRLLYGFSDVLCFVLVLTGYRREVIKTNLKNSFPEKSAKEIHNMYKQYYSYLCDLIVETIKTLKMTEKESRERCVFHHTDWLDRLYAEQKSIIVVMGHYGNWELAGPSFTLNTKYQLVVVYRPLSNKYFEKMMCGMRTKFGTKIVAVNNTLREMVANRKDVTATAFIADQAASPETAYWTTFLHQDTAVFNGPEKIAKKFGYPVVYMNIKRTKRGYYEIFPELMFEKPSETTENEILETFTRRLETEIIKDPITWLWSHKRWKHKRKQNLAA